LSQRKAFGLLAGTGRARLFVSSRIVESTPEGALRKLRKLRKLPLRASQAERIKGWLRSTFNYPNAAQQEEAIRQTARAANKPAYQAAYAAGDREIWSPELERYSPEYRALGIEPCSALCMMLCALHEAGLTTMFWCDDCDCLHPMDDKQAGELKYHAISGAEGVMPEHKTAQ
jgi:hypothetical protein